MSKNIILISIYGFLYSISVQMLYSHLVLFLKYKLGADEYQIASIDGFVEFLSYVIRIFSGVISDYIYNRNLLLIIGCTIVVLIKPVFCFASSVVTVIIAEIVERIGNGIQAVPRDALIADLSRKNSLGKSFGFYKSMKTFGAMLGAFIAIGIMYFSLSSYKILFISSAIPAFIALIIVCNSRFLYKHSDIKFDNPFQKKYLKSLDKRFFCFMIFAFLCELGHFAESLLTIRCSELMFVSGAGITTVFASFGQILFLYPVGLLADRFKKSILLIICIFIAMMAYILMVTTQSVVLFLLGTLLSCGQFASMQLLFLSVINTIVHFKLRATAIGIFYSIVGCSYLISSKFCGILYKHFGYNGAMCYVIIICFISFIISIFFAGYEKTCIISVKDDSGNLEI